jgi:integrase/recombinase XerD
MDLRQALDSYILQQEADGRAASTIAQAREHIGLLDRWLRERGVSPDVKRIGHEQLAAFLASPAVRQRRDGAPRKATSANVLRSKVRSFFAYLADAGYIERNPARLIRRARCSPPPPRTLSEAEIERLLAAVDAGTTRAARRDAALIRLMLGTGLRLSSALAVRVEDVDAARGQIHVRRTKGDAPITLPISRTVARDLRAYVRALEGDLLFPGKAGQPLNRRQAQLRIGRWAVAAGLKGRVSAHVLRHIFAARLYARTGDLLVVQQALGHRAVASTMAYARANASRLRTALAI